MAAAGAGQYARTASGGQLPAAAYERAGAGQAGPSQLQQSRRVPSTSSIASSSGTAYSSTRGSYPASASGGPGRTSSNGSNITAHLETTVTKLLVATKQLLEGLTDWSQGRITEEQVSDIYVRLGNCFNAAVTAFSKEGISMRDLKEVPQLLRVRLEDAINEEASRETLNKHLPKIRPIVLDLLRGLRHKQEQHAAMLAAAAAQDEPVAVQQHVLPYPGHKSGVPHQAYSDPVASTSRTRQPSEQNSIHTHETSGAQYPDDGRASPAPSFSGASTTSRSASRTAGRPPSSLEADGQCEVSSGRRTPNQEPSRRPSGGSYKRPASAVKASAMRAGRTDQLPPPDVPLPPLPTQTIPAQSTSRGPLPQPNGYQHLHPPKEEVFATPPTIRTTQASPASYAEPPPVNSAFATPPRSSLRPMASSTREKDDASLEALKKADPLARRASKRFSAYTFNKISSSTSLAGSPSTSFPSTFPSPGKAYNDRDSSARDFVHSGGRMDLPDGEPSTDDAHRRRPKGKSTSPRPRFREIAEPVPALPPHNAVPRISLGFMDNNTSNKKRVSIVTEETEDQLANEDSRDASKDMGSSHSEPATAKATLNTSDPDLLRTSRSGSAVSIASTVSQYSQGDHDSHAPSRKPSLASEVRPATSQSRTIYLQLGRDVKKATLDQTEPPTFASLRMLFTDRFAYNPGMTDFPAIYLRDPHSGVQYELEDITEIKDHSVLSLNIEPLDQVRQHIDEGLAALARELKDIKAGLNKRVSVAPAPPVPAPMLPEPLAASPSLASSPQARPVPSDSQVQQAAKDVLQMKRKLSSISVPAEGEGAAQNIVSPAASMTSMSEARVHRLATELRTSFDDVQSVRREVGALRQVYLDFRNQTGSMLGILKAQAAHVKEMANTKVTGERAYIDEGKVKLDNRSQVLLTKIEELQDAIDDLKNDVVQRKVKPKPRQMDQIKIAIQAAEGDLESLGQYITTVKPMWKKTWETELQNIVDEQQLLNHQEELLGDLRADHENVVTVFTQIQQYLSLQSTAKGRKSEFRPPSPEAGHEGLRTVMMEVKGLAPASDKRMKAIEMAEKQRLKEADGKTDEFAHELSGFVEGKMLKKTGGAEETERIRQMKSEASLRAMFNTSASSSPLPPPPPPLPAVPAIVSGPTPAPASPSAPSNIPLPPSSSKTSLAEASHATKDPVTTEAAREADDLPISPVPETPSRDSQETSIKLQRGILETADIDDIFVGGERPLSDDEDGTPVTTQQDQGGEAGS